MTRAGASLRCAWRCRSRPSRRSTSRRRTGRRAFSSAPGFREEAWRNRLIWGDKKYVLPSLLAEFAGKVNLIYIDPPFDTGADFSFTATVPDDPEVGRRRRHSRSQKSRASSSTRPIATLGGAGSDSYLQWFYETSSIACTNCYTKRQPLCAFGLACRSIMPRSSWTRYLERERFLNEIVWKRTTAHSNDISAYGDIDCTNDPFLLQERRMAFGINTSPITNRRIH